MISAGAIGTYVSSAGGGTTVDPPYPTGISAGQMLVLTVWQKPTTLNDGTVTTPAGWTLVGSSLAGGGYSSAANSQGNTNLYYYTKVASGSETGTLAVTLSDNSMSSAQIAMFRTDSGGWGTSTVTTGAQNSTPVTPWSATAGSSTTLQEGDMVVASFAPATFPSANFTDHTMDATGFRFAWGSELVEGGSSAGDDIGSVWVLFRVIAGTAGSATLHWAAAISGTLTNQRGAYAFLRLRDTAAALPTKYVTAASVFKTTSINAWSIDIPSEVQVGDFGILVVSIDVVSATTVTIPGWTLRTAQFTAGTMSSLVFTKMKFNDTTIPITLSVSRTGSATVFWLRGVSGFLQTGTYGIRPSNGTTVTAPGITTTTTGNTIALFADRSSAAAGTTVETDSINSLTWGRVVAQGDSNPLTGNPTVGIPTNWLVMYDQTPAGATGDNTATFQDTATSAWGVVIELDTSVSTAVAYTDAFETVVATSGIPIRYLDALEVVVAASIAQTTPTNDLWVWNGTTEIAANVTVWNGTSEVASSVAVT